MNELIKESFFMCDTLDLKGFQEGDIIEVTPIEGRKKRVLFNYKSLEFISHNLESKPKKNWVHVLPSLKIDQFHIEIMKVKTVGKKGLFRTRTYCKSLTNQPFFINNVLTTAAFLEDGDVINLGYNTLKFKSQENEKQFSNKKYTDELAKSDLLVLLEGETGVGKTHLAYEIHKDSGRKGAFIHLNLASFQESLLEGELFGHVKGAFTGAHNDREGAFEAARNGTLFLDEIDSLSLDLQTKLLLFLDDKKFRRVGSTRIHKTNARIIVATGRSLGPLVNLGEMRKDFYFRLSCAHHIKLLPLRVNIKEVENYCLIFSDQNSISISPKLVEFYQTLPWPGNYRQLHQHLLKKKVYMQGRKLVFDHIDDELLKQSSDLFNIKGVEEEILSLEEIKRIYVMSIYNKLNGNMGLTSEKLNISQNSVRRFLGLRA